MSPDRPLNVLQVCDHLGWDGSRMHGVKRLFAWMIPRFDRTRFNVSLISLRKRDVSEETLESMGIEIEYLHRSKFDPATPSSRSRSGSTETATCSRQSRARTIWPIRMRVYAHSGLC